MQLRDLCLAALASHPAGFGISALRKRLACVGGDGQITVGGPERRHQSSGAAEKIWETLHPSPPMFCCSWDDFHKADLAVARAVTRSSPAQEIFDTAACLDSMFAIGDGKLILRAAAHQADVPAVKMTRAGGTRKIGHLSTVPGNMLQNYRAIVLGLHARLSWRKGGGGSQSLQHLTEVGRKIQNTCFAAFLCLFSDLLLKIVRPFVMTVQDLREPWLVLDANATLLRGLKNFQKQLRKSAELLFVHALCAQHLSSKELARRLTRVPYSLL